ncbi:MAG: hypothetical protein ACRD2L_02560, partial [Terriglobia bacterium]
MTAPTPDDKTLLFKQYLVVFVDVLGQRARLRELKGIPSNEKEREEFLRVVKETFGIVQSFRDAFKGFFEGFSPKNLPDDTSSGKFSPEVRQQIAELRRNDLEWYGLSDATLIAVPVGDEREHCPAINGIYAALLAAGGILLTGLSLERPLRGGIAFGVGA